MTSREIVIGLIDKGAIDGEQAATLLNDVYQAELLESWKALNNKGNHDLAKEMLKENGGYWASPNSSWASTTDYVLTASDAIATSSATISV